VKCHGADGTGGPGRDRLPEIPDFTRAAWQARRTDAQLKASILDGKGALMPPWRGKAGAEQVRGLVAYVRSFAPAAAKPGPGEQNGPASAGFQEQFRRLEKQMGKLDKQYRKQSEVSPGGAPSRPSESGRPEVARPSAPEAPGSPASRALFRKHCVKCHGADGTGKKARDRLPEIPDFANTSWQARRTDAQLKASILDGKGKEMPPWRGKAGAEQVRGLVAYVRSFAPATARPARRRRDRATPPHGAGYVIRRSRTRVRSVRVRTR
jgi:mono/diheme cytochrome c family protein